MKSKVPNRTITNVKSPIRKYITQNVKNVNLLSIPNQTHPRFLLISKPTIKYPIPYTKINPNNECKKNSVGGCDDPNNSKTFGKIRLKIKNDKAIIQLNIPPILNKYV